jgi:predicted ATPase
VSEPVGLARIRIRGFRSIRDATLRPGRVCALVGEASVGKSNVLEAIRALLDPSAPPISRGDTADGARVRIEAQTVSGKRLRLDAEPPASLSVKRDGAPPVLFVPASLRTGEVVAPGEDGTATPAAELFRHRPSPRREGRAAPAAEFVEGLERACAGKLRGLVLLVEEPELYLRPHLQRYLYRLIHTFTEAGNQVLYSTHSPAFLNVARLDELALTVHDRETGTQIHQPKPLPATSDFRALAEFDALRSELFLARAAVLVEGRTEQLVFPYVFRRLGHDPDREGISIVECGGKGNLPLFVRVCQAARIPYVVVHDRDAEPGSDPIAGERVRNELIAEIAGPERTIVLEPDFEGVAGLRGHGHKPERARERFAAGGDVPEPLRRAAELALALARG